MNLEPRLFKEKVSRVLVSMNANNHKSKGYSVNTSERFVINLFKNSSNILDMYSMLEEFILNIF
ncbi:hypothetical protein CN898_28145 [Bacillus thuringiensis]|nr:hypothetical protein COJ28_06845 [Bacillus thuringiensis]PGH91821.1 hypothetical protein CN898_28145 [Bacillus thuringiensis]PGU39670.1 hypothetical protein COD63_21430 [Bacillus thuringiensis]